MVPFALQFSRTLHDHPPDLSPIRDEEVEAVLLELKARFGLVGDGERFHHGLHGLWDVQVSSVLRKPFPPASGCSLVNRRSYRLTLMVALASFAAPTEVMIPLSLTQSVLVLINPVWSIASASGGQAALISIVHGSSLLEKEAVCVSVFLGALTMAFCESLATVGTVCPNASARRCARSADLRNAAWSRRGGRIRLSVRRERGGFGSI